MDEYRIPPAGDPFSSQVPHVCNNGWVSVGQLVLDPETGEEVEEFALYLCRRCAEAKRSGAGEERCE